MQRTITFALNQFPQTPSTLIEADGSLKAEIPVELSQLYHHYYQDTHGCNPPNPDPAQFEHLRFLTNTDDFRVLGDGIGSSTVARRHKSTELGQAFCRWFLHEHLGIVYFAHVKDALDGKLHPNYLKYRMKKIKRGDAPDYFCARNTANIFLAEAKGRYAPVGFHYQEFANWRKQFGRVVISDGSGTPRKVKGIIAATRFATENKPHLRSAIFVEDPDTRGEVGFDEEESQRLAQIVIAAHYSKIAEKLRLPILSAALAGGFSVPEEIRFPVAIWNLQIGPLSGTKFVGGYFPPREGGADLFQVTNDRVVRNDLNFLRLDVGKGTFFGIEENIFRQVVKSSRQRYALSAGTQINQFEQIQPFYSGVSILRDGSIIGPLEFFSLSGTDAI